MPEAPRSEERFLLPAVTIWIPATLKARNGDLHGRLWDVSQSGCCLLFPPGSGLYPGMAGPLMITHPSSNQMISTGILVHWVDREAGGTYAGCRFTERVDFKRTFLRTLMHSQQTTRPPGGRLI